MICGIINESTLNSLLKMNSGLLRSEIFSSLSLQYWLTFSSELFDLLDAGDKMMTKIVSSP